MKTLLLVAACLAIANAQTTTSVEARLDIHFVMAHTTNENIKNIELRANEHHDLDEEGRRLWIEIQATNKSISSGAIIFTQTGNEVPGTMDAATCFDLCMKLKDSVKNRSPALFQHHNWLMGPVRDQTETNHIVRVMNAIWRDKLANAPSNPTVVSFWPTNGTEVGEPNSVGDFAFYNQQTSNDLKNGVNRMWIGLFGDAGQKDLSGQAKGTLPFLLGIPQAFSKTWVQSPGYQYASDFLNNVAFTSTINTVTVASSFYEFLPFQNFSEPTLPNWKTVPQVFPKLNEPATGGVPFGACVAMTPSWDANTLPGQWENAPCSDKATGCFCRAVCSVAEADACHRLRKCSTDGTSIVDNYEFDYEECKCARVAPKRCCTECGGDDNTTDTNGRLVPTECRGAVPGDPFYVVGGVYADDAQFPDPALVKELEDMYPTPTNDPRRKERGYKQCRRIRFGSPKVPLFLGNADNTLDVYNAADLRRDLPAQ